MTPPLTSCWPGLRTRWAVRRAARSRSTRTLPLRVAPSSSRPTSAAPSPPSRWVGGGGGSWVGSGNGLATCLTWQRGSLGLQEQEGATAPFPHPPHPRAAAGAGGAGGGQSGVCVREGGHPGHAAQAAAAALPCGGWVAYMFDSACCALPKKQTELAAGLNCRTALLGRSRAVAAAAAQHAALLPRPNFFPRRHEPLRHRRRAAAGAARA